MKILFLHLSDLHIGQSENIEIRKIDKLVDSLNILQGFDECIIICSGDLASRGYENDYKNVRYLFGNLISKIREKFCKGKFLTFLLVPGNHDADFTNAKRTGETIQQYYNENKIDQHIDDEIKMFRNYFSYSERHSCFKYEKIYNKRFITIGDYTIQVNLINSALFSTLLPNDKELHYFPKEKLSQLSKQDNANIAITIMHHSTEWFQGEYKKDLEKAIYSDSAILFLGHDHDLCTKDLNINNNHNVFISAGGEFSNKDITEKSEFNAILLDSQSNCLDSYEFKWNNSNNFYVYKKLFDKRSIISNQNRLMPNEIYINLIKEDEKRKVTKDFTQYFVFPTLTGKYKYEGKSEEIEISDLDDFANELHKRKYINIVGGENSGKTALLKILFLELLETMTPLFFTIESIKGKNLNKIIRLMFEDQYSEEALQYQMYQQLDKCRKVAIIDDFDIIKTNKSEIIALLKDQFDFIIIGTKSFEEYSIINSVKNEINEKNIFSVLKINDFYLTKRHTLIKNVCRVSKLMDEEDIEKIIQAINSLVKHQFQLFDLDPDFIIQFTQFFLNSSNLQNIKNDAIFNKIFETNIYNAIIQNSKKDSVDETITSLEEIAYYLHFNKKDPLPLADLQKVIDKYNEDYSLNVNVKTLVDVACKAKILKYADDSFSLKFCNKNYLAFFVARYLNRKFIVDGSFSDIEYILKNICFGINDNIILFISYLTSNPRVIMSIYKTAETLMKDWDEFDIDKENVKFLTKFKGEQEVNAPNNQDKHKIEELENLSEIERKKDQLIECGNLYDYDETKVDKFNYTILRALKYTEMLAKSLPNFHNILLKEDKQKLNEGIYKFPNKILLKFLRPVDENFNKIIKEVKSFADSIDDISISVSESDIESMIYNNALSLILNVYENFASLAADRKSIGILDNYKLDNSNYKIFNLMVAENYGEIQEFTKKADDIFDNAKANSIKTMVALIVKKHLIYTEKMKLYRRQHLIDKFFSAKDAKKVRRTFLLKTQKENIK